MDVIAITTSLALAFDVLLTFRIREISDRREFRLQLLLIVVTSLQSHQALESFTFSHVFDVDITLHVVTDVVANDQIVDFTVISQLEEDFLIEFFIVIQSLLSFFFTDSVALSQCQFCGRILVHVLDQNGLTLRRSVVDSQALILISASTNLKVEGTIHLVLFSTVHTTQFLSHFFLISY